MGILYFVCGVFVGVTLMFAIEAANRALDRYVDGGDDETPQH